MSEEMIVGPFGRLLPRPAPSRSGSDSSNIPNARHSFDRQGWKHTVPSGGSNNSGVHLPPFDQILPHSGPSVSTMRHSSSGSSMDTGLNYTHRSASRTESSISTSRENTSLFAQRDQPREGAEPEDRRGMQTLLYHRNALPKANDSSIPYSGPTHTLHDDGITLRSLPTLTHPQGQRVLREEMVPGKGVCYVYEDGSLCPKVVDGDSVNPIWGITKAGKPRKRLAQACTTCREKKIKCDPSSPKCLQCQKFGRECRFEPFAPNSQRSTSPSSVSQSPTASIAAAASPVLHRDSTISNDPTLYSSSRPLSSSKSSIAVESLLSPTSLDVQDMEESTYEKPNKRQRQSGSSASTPVDLQSEASYSKKRSAPPNNLQLRGRPLGLDTDPYQLDPKLTDHYLELYFDNINANIYNLFPRGLFMTWVRQNNRKTLWDRMLLFAMLAHGTLFARNREHQAHGSIFSKVAHRAESQTAGKFILQVVQTRLILALYNVAKGQHTKAWDYSGAALRAACGMKLNMEEGVVDFDKAKGANFDFSATILIECQRRTFWSVLLMDRSIAFRLGHVICHNAECFLKLPCDERMYEEGRIPDTPFFDGNTISTNKINNRSQSSVGMMGHLVQVLSFWTTIALRLHQIRHRVGDLNLSSPETFYELAEAQLNAWQKQLPSHLQVEIQTEIWPEPPSWHLRVNSDNIAIAKERGNLGAFGGLHFLHYCARMRLNRHIYPASLDPAFVMRNMQQARNSALKVLQLVRALSDQATSGRKSGSAMSTPFTGYAIVGAFDILTATGTVADLLDSDSHVMSLLTNAIAVLESLVPYWKTAEQHLKLVTERYSSILALRNSPDTAAKVGFYAKEPLVSFFGAQTDLFYSIPRRMYLEVIGQGHMIRNDEDLLEIRPNHSHANAEGSESVTRDHSTWFDDGNDDDEEDEMNEDE